MLIFLLLTAVLFTSCNALQNVAYLHPMSTRVS